MKLSADLIIPVKSKPIENGVIVCDEHGKILDVQDEVTDFSGVKRFRGVLVPGFVNAHCHLELSHMKSIIPSGTGLIKFIEKVVTLREFPYEFILEAIRSADQEMYEHGIVAVGDISNKTDTIAIKASSPIRYYTFVEMFDFLQPEMARSTYERYMPVFDALSDHSEVFKSLSPHSPYTVSGSLFRIINDQNADDVSISIHNQETWEEHIFFLEGMGKLIDFYANFNLDISHFKPTGKSSIYYTMEHLSPGFRTLFVHNTTTSIPDIQAAQAWNEKLYWVTCPNANLYIENRLPDYESFIKAGAKMCIGTDSLSSNWRLCVLEEMKTIKKFNSFIDDLDIVQWATQNGAEALGFERDLGSFEVGKTPGINHLKTDLPAGKFDILNITSLEKVI